MLLHKMLLKCNMQKFLIYRLKTVYLILIYKRNVVLQEVCDDRELYFPISVSPLEQTSK